MKNNKSKMEKQSMGMVNSSPKTSITEIHSTDGYEEVGTLTLDLIVDGCKEAEFSTPLIYHKDEGVFSPLIYKLKGLPIGKDLKRTPYARNINSFNDTIDNIVRKKKPEGKKMIVNLVHQLSDCYKQGGSAWASLLPVISSPPKTAVKIIVEVVEIDFFDPNHQLRDRTRRRYEDITHVISHGIISKDFMKDPEVIGAMAPIIQRLLSKETGFGSSPVPTNVNQEKISSTSDVHLV